MKVSKKGLIMALKNLGVFIGAYQVSGIAAEPEKFLFGLAVYALIAIPSDLYLLNHIESDAKKKGALGVD